MTKVTILGEEPQKELKKIEFVKQVTGNKLSDKIYDSTWMPRDFKYIELICKSPNDEHYDIMFAYDENNRENGIIYLGHFNDGIV